MPPAGDHPQRTRTISWSDPMIGAAAAPGMSGLDYLQAMMRGEIPPPPIAHLMDMRPVEAERGRVVFSVQPAEFHYNPIGVVHGGLAATLLDSAMGCAVHSTLPAGVRYTTLDLQLHFVRAITAATGALRCEGTVVHQGSRVMTTEGRVTDASGRLYAHGSGTCMIFRPDASAPAG
ncbi:MAG: PaaI family thioesterase [Gemmatimonadota bacterium]|nr:PaaI family thioesterase [Gemmatimonadota bacterium]